MNTSILVLYLYSILFHLKYVALIVHVGNNIDIVLDSLPARDVARARCAANLWEGA